jgi:glyoxylase-like metal-dependent hydrolase (beta-lactamase superfamily II)
VESCSAPRRGLQRVLHSGPCPPPLLEEADRTKAVGHPLGDVTPDTGAVGQVGRREDRGQVIGNELEKIDRVVESAPLDDLPQHPIGGAETSPPPPRLRIHRLDLRDRHQHHFEAQIRMVEQRRDADQFLEQAVDRSPFRRPTRLGPGFLEIGLNRDGMYEQNPMFGQKTIELATHRSERTGLYLDQETVAPDVDDEAVECHFELIAGLGVVGLQRRMQRTFVECADVRFGSDHAMVDRRTTDEETRVTESTGPQRKGQSILVGAASGQVLGDGLVVLPGQGNSLAVETGRGVVVLDVSGYGHAAGMLETLRTHTDAPIHAVVYSHGHLGYNAALDVWEQHNRDRGDPPLRVVAHENLPVRNARYRETMHLQARLASMQFPGPATLDRLIAGLPVHDPTETFAERLMLVDGPRRVELIWAPSEVDDALAMWLPDDGLLCGGAATPGFSIPNIGTPLRTQRFTIRWADTLDRLAALGAERLLTEFGPVIEGANEVRHQLSATSEALRWLRAEVVDRMNRGMDEGEILADMTYPPELFDQPWMQPNYGDPGYIVRDLFREENGWWDRNPTTLHPAPPPAAHDAVRSAITDPAAVLSRARELQAAGETQLALHVVDLLALAPGDDPDVVAARELKAELCRERAKQVRPFVSHSLYRSSARLLDNGHTSWTHLS